MAIALAFLATTALTWRKWPDVLTDFGAQLYLPWQLSMGRVLYLEVPYLTGGPLSQYYHALLFKLFGVSLLTLVISNLVLAAGLLVLVYRRFLTASDAWTATTICLGITLTFAFNQYSDIGNFNFITPYCHEIWHGLVLSILTIALLSSWVEKGRIKYAAAAGFCSGLVFLTKAEIFAALTIAATGAFVLFWLATKQARVLWQSVAGFLFAASAPVLGFALYFHRFEDWKDSFRSAAFAWVPLLHSSASNNPFYKWCMGLDAPGYNLRVMLTHFLIVALVVGLCAVLFRRNMDKSINRLGAIVLVATILALASGFDWVDCGRSLPLLGLALCGALCVQIRESLNETGGPEKTKRSMILVFPLLWGLFGLALLVKLGLYSRIWHYGFALAMPAFAGAIFLVLWLLPRLLERFGVRPLLFRGAIWLVLMLGILRLFVQSEQVYQTKTVAVGHGSDQILGFKESINPTPKAINSALEWLATNAPPEATLAVLPEGVMVNYLARRTNPAGYFIWNPVELSFFGQTNMAKAFQDHAPDFIMLIHRDTAEFGVKYFGQEARFGLDLMQWISQNYTPVCLIGNEPLRNVLFGIKILRRNPL
jgi:hypothetical protein